MKKELFNRSEVADQFFKAMEDPNLLSEIVNEEKNIKLDQEVIDIINKYSSIYDRDYNNTEMTRADFIATFMCTGYMLYGYILKKELENAYNG